MVAPSAVKVQLDCSHTCQAFECATGLLGAVILPNPFEKICGGTEGGGVESVNNERNHNYRCSVQCIQNIRWDP